MSKHRQGRGTPVILDAITFKRLKAMDFQNLNRWALSLYNSGRQDGAAEVQEESISPEVLIEEIAKVKGVGPKMKQAIYEVLKRIEQEALERK